MKVDPQRCTACGKCVTHCPLEAVVLRDRVATIQPECVDCGVCARVCPEGAVQAEPEPPDGRVVCGSCPVGCRIAEGHTGACRRYVARNGELVRTTRLHTFDDVRDVVGPDWEPAIREPLVTGIGAGTTYPDARPAPVIVRGTAEGVDVVTVVTEAPLSYSSVRVKVDTDVTLGAEGAPILAGGEPVGHVTTEEYGSKMLAVGGVNVLTGPHGFRAARVMTDLLNRRRVKLRVEGGSRLELQLGEAPVIDGVPVGRMRVGCGSATIGLFAPVLREAADEVIVLDSHLTGVLTEHPAGRYLGLRPSGVRLRFRPSTPGRYFGDHGPGWGGTTVTDPRDVFAPDGVEALKPGSTILVTETTGKNAALFRVVAPGKLVEIPLTPAARSAVNAVAETCEPSRVSVLYCGGTGGSARAGVTRHPIRLTRAVHEGKARLTVGGAPTFLLPGGGINFVVDAGRIASGAFTWVPTPALVAPVEYTMRLEDFEAIGGHTGAMRPLDEVVRERPGRAR
ncbi:MAG: 6-hydroxynicotinate reductase [Candidatus Dadabacteria bacterium]|nr:MAG: 6-hydroxynicotinate reductase [Candidatus Dadabacteria bacterium]